MVKGKGQQARLIANFRARADDSVYYYTNEETRACAWWGTWRDVWRFACLGSYSCINGQISEEEQAW